MFLLACHALTPILTLYPTTTSVCSAERNGLNFGGSAALLTPMALPFPSHQDLLTAHGPAGLSLLAPGELLCPNVG